MLGHTGLLCSGNGLWVFPAWQGLPPNSELLDVTDRPLNAVASILPVFPTTFDPHPARFKHRNAVSSKAATSTDINPTRRDGDITDSITLEAAGQERLMASFLGQKINSRLLMLGLGAFIAPP